jgi:hypothetical protein
MSAKLLGEEEWDLSVDDDGFKTYTVNWLAETSSPFEGPNVVFNTPGLFQTGAIWQFEDNDGNVKEEDEDCLCLPSIKVSPIVRGEPNWWWSIIQTFSNKPVTALSQESEIKGPASIPPKIRGTYVKHTVEALKDRNNKPIRNSAFQRISGKAVEFDKSNMTIVVELMRAQLDDLDNYIDHLNDREIWGKPVRSVKLSNVTFERLVYGKNTFFYNEILDFDTDIILDENQQKVSGFDRRIPNYSTLQLTGNDKNDPDSYTTVTQKIDNDRAEIILNLDGTKWNGQGPVPTITAEYYPEANFFDLGVPTSL